MTYMSYMYECVCVYTTWHFFSLSFKTIAILTTFPHILRFINLPQFWGWLDNSVRKKEAFEVSMASPANAFMTKRVHSHFWLFFRKNEYFDYLSWNDNPQT